MVVLPPKRARVCMVRRNATTGADTLRWTCAPVKKVGRAHARLLLRQTRLAVAATETVAETVEAGIAEIGG